ncbi:WecB/TagA/CpsF family glycosyltransferase [Microvirga sp. Marseille-Q2068]|uniref:WecB/TagA/CpsF family glycosyltransferase n=1 Tax=Microvirga mediterraneensis TaxID=2754695 RepID=A0A838BNT2_9HYPH|nr:WecB/TagA/CpsF family glycosyltransferase [Microvirga mediterraneensis]MBA1157011.1 WecB/TagA/CpsF family glycosyltransferase [Microvirga mediterraneensis]
MRVTFLDTPIDVLSTEETVQCAIDSMRHGKRIRHVAINVAKLVKMQSDPALRADVINSDIIGIDGAGIVIGARLQGIPVPERVAGIDLMEEVLKECSKQGFRPYFLGATEEIVQRAASVARNRYSGLSFAGVRNGYFTTSEERDIVEEINRSGADCLFIGMPTPRKENFLAAHAPHLNVPFLMGVGGSFDVLAGKVSRAPAPMQKLGLEWMHRLLQEPRRMFWRYASTNYAFAILLSRAMFANFAKSTKLALSSLVRGH